MEEERDRRCDKWCRAKEMISEDLTRSVGIDGRISDFGSMLPTHLMPIISDRWSSHFEWRGEGSISKEGKNKLRDMVKRLIMKVGGLDFGQLKKKSVWTELVDSGVDLINTDDLKGLSKFIRDYSKSEVTFFSFLISLCF